MQKEQLPPHDIDAEESLIGSLLIDSSVYPRVSTIVTADDFVRQGHRHIFETITSFFIDNKEVDHVSVASDLRSRGVLEEVGGLEAIATIVKAVPTSIHAVQYARAVSDASRRRKLIEVGKRITELGYDTKTELRAAISGAENEVMNLLGEESKTSLTLIKDTMDEHLDAISRPIGGDEDRAIKTGYGRLNDMVGGFHHGDMIVLAARPSIGKSMLALNFVLRIAREGRRVAVFSLEMGAYEVGMRLLATASSVSMHSIRTRRLGSLERERLVDAVGLLSDTQIYVDETAVSTPAEMRAKLQLLHRSKPVDFVVIDYLQLMGSGKRREQNRTQEVGEISRDIKAIARDLQVPVLAISQLNREVEKRASRPMLSNLRDSGSIEQDADVVMFIHREDKMVSERDWAMNNPGQPYPKNLVELIVAKHRHGPTGSVFFTVKEDRGLIEEGVAPGRSAVPHPADVYN